MKYVNLTSSEPFYNLNVLPEPPVEPPTPPDSCSYVVCDEDPIIINSVTKSRSGIIWSVSDSTHFEFTIGQPKLFSPNGSVALVPFEEILGSADVKSIDNLVELLKTKPFKITKDSLRIGCEVIVRNPNGLILPGTPYGKLKFEVVDATTGNVLLRIGNEISIEQSSKIRFNSKASVKKLEGRTVHIQPRFVGFPKRNLSGTIINNYYLKNIITPIAKSNNTENNQKTNQLPTEYELSQNYPNPFNPITQINYAIPEPGFVTLKIYDVLGREVAVLVNEHKEAGYYEISWDATAQPSGVYFYKLQSGNFTSVKKMLLVR